MIETAGASPTHKPAPSYTQTACHTHTHTASLPQTYLHLCVLTGKCKCEFSFMHLYTIPGPCTNAYLRHNLRVSDAFTHTFFPYTYLDCHININMGINSHIDLYQTCVNVLTAVFRQQTMYSIRRGLRTGTCVSVYRCTSPLPSHADIHSPEFVLKLPQCRDCGPVSPCPP